MRPKTLSASSIESYLGCPKRFAAEMAKVQINSVPGLFGTALHAALDAYIARLNINVNIPAEHDLDLLLRMWEGAHIHYMGFDEEMHATGVEILTRWVETRDLPYEVLSRESKEHFDVEVADDEPQSITFIIDRLDRHPDGSVEVIDYKSQWAALNGEEMRRLVQPALYAVAARRKFPDLKEVKVTYDFLRHNTVSVIYDTEAMDSFERFLSGLAKRVREDNDPQERLNPKCNWCPRKGVCSTLLKATEIGWTPTMTLEELSAVRSNVASAKKALEQTLEDVDTMILTHLREIDTDVIEVDGYEITASRKRFETFDPEVVLRVLGDDAIPYLKVGKTALEKELRRKKGGRFDPEQYKTIKDLAIVTYGNPSVSVVAKGAHDVE